MRGLDFPLEWPTLHNYASVFLIISILEGTYPQDGASFDQSEPSILPLNGILFTILLPVLVQWDHSGLPNSEGQLSGPMRALDFPLEWPTF